jgi:2-dehydropantoate 2-reductase
VSALGFAVLGPGAVGGLIAAALHRAGQPVTVIAREPTAELIEREGIAVHSVRLGDFRAHPQAVPRLDVPVDVLVVATKAGGLAGALERVTGEPELVVPMLNGLDHLPRLRERFGSRAVAGTIRVEADLPQPAIVVQTSPFLYVEMASDDPARRPQLEAAAQAFDAADVPAGVGESEAQVMWSKLVRLNALACTTAAADRPVKFIRTHPEWGAALEACVAEGAAVAVEEGARIDARTVMDELAQVHDELGTSMQRDVAAGRPPELDQIPGAVLRAGARHGLECPTIARLAEQIARRAGVPAPRP